MLLERFPHRPGVADRMLRSIDGEWYYQEERTRTKPPPSDGPPDAPTELAA
jgi:hypothetical protein